MKKIKLPISVLFTIGGYENEIYDKKRIKWLKKSINDLKSQTKYPAEIIVSINKTVSRKKFVKGLIKDNIPNSHIIISNFYRSPILNMEMLIQIAKEKYICFWTDHDFHHPNFIEDLYEQIDLLKKENKKLKSENKKLKDKEKK